MDADVDNTLFCKKTTFINNMLLIYQKTLRTYSFDSPYLSAAIKVEQGLANFNCMCALWPFGWESFFHWYRHPTEKILKCNFGHIVGKTWVLCNFRDKYFEYSLGILNWSSDWSFSIFPQQCKGTLSMVLWVWSQVGAKILSQLKCDC